MMRKTTLAVLFFLATSAVGGGEVQEVSVSIDLSNSGVPFSRDLLGANIDAEESHEPNYGVSRDYDTLGPLETPAVRYPGGTVGNWFHWAQTLGPVPGRAGQWWGTRALNAKFVPYLGAGEYLKLLHRLKARGMIILNLAEGGTPEEAAAWVAFCRGRIGDTRPIGTDAAGTDWKTVGYWAQKRREETGILEPVNVAYWELGNELPVNPDYFKTAQTFARKIRMIDPTVLIGWLGWDQAACGQETNLIDFLIYHSYTGWPDYGDCKYIIWCSETLTGEFECPRAGEYEIGFRISWVPLGVPRESVPKDKIPQVSVGIDDQALERLTLTSEPETRKYKVKLSAGNHRLQITFLNDTVEADVEIAPNAYTVTGGGKTRNYRFPPKQSDIRKDIQAPRKDLLALAEECKKIAPHVFIGVTEYNRMEYAVFDLRTALYVAEFLRMASEIPQVRTAMIWNACSINFGMRCSSFNTTRPVYYIFEMMKELQDRIVPVTISPEDKDIRILATKDSMGDGVSILLINLGETPKKIEFKTPAGGALAAVEKEFLGGSDLSANNEKNEQIKLNVQKMEGNLTALDVPAYSVTLLKAKVKQETADNK